MEQRAAVLINILETKMNLVKTERTKLHGALDAYVDKMTETAQETIKVEDQDMDTIREVSTKMEATLEFLLGLSMEFKGDPARQRSTVSDHQILPFASPLVETTSSPATCSPHHQFQNSESAGIIELQNRVKTVEAAIAMCRHEASQNTAQHDKRLKENTVLYHTLEERMDKYEKLILEVKEKQSNAFEETSERTKTLEAQNNDQGERLKAAEYQLQEFERNRTASEKEQDRKIADFGNKITQIQKEVGEKMKDIEAGMVDDIQQKLNELRKTHAKVQEKQAERLDELESELKEQQSQQADLMRRVRSKKEAKGKRITDLENKVANNQTTFHTLSDNVEKLKTQYSKRHQSSKLKSVEEQLNQLTSHLTVLEENVQGDIKDLKDTTAGLKSNLGQLASKEDLCDVMKTSMKLSKSTDALTVKVEATEALVKGCVPYSEKEENKRKEMEDRILVVEENRRKDLEHYAQKLEEVESQYKQVCQIVDNRVTPLRRLQRLLHEYHQSVETREELSSRLDQAMEEMNSITNKVDSLVTRGQQIGIGFTAHFPRCKIIKNAMVINNFDDLTYNVGKHFNAESGIFTAPCDGVFITSVVLTKQGNPTVHVCIVCRRYGVCSKLARKEVCRVAVNDDKTSRCGIAVVKLMKGNELFVEAVTSEGIAMISSYSSFSCVKVA